MAWENADPSKSDNKVALDSWAVPTSIQGTAEVYIMREPRQQKQTEQARAIAS